MMKTFLQKMVHNDLGDISIVRDKPKICITCKKCGIYLETSGYGLIMEDDPVLGSRMKQPLGKDTELIRVKYIYRECTRCSQYVEIDPINWYKEVTVKD